MKKLLVLVAILSGPAFAGKWIKDQDVCRNALIAMERLAASNLIDAVSLTTSLSDNYELDLEIGFTDALDGGLSRFGATPTAKLYIHGTPEFVPFTELHIPGYSRSVPVKVVDGVDTNFRVSNAVLALNRPYAQAKATTFAGKEAIMSFLIGLRAGGAVNPHLAVAREWMEGDDEKRATTFVKVGVSTTVVGIGFAMAALPFANAIAVGHENPAGVAASISSMTGIVGAFVAFAVASIGNEPGRRFEHLPTNHSFEAFDALVEQMIRGEVPAKPLHLGINGDNYSHADFIFFPGETPRLGVITHRTPPL